MLHLITVPLLDEYPVRCWNAYPLDLGVHQTIPTLPLPQESHVRVTSHVDCRKYLAVTHSNRLYSASEEPHHNRPENI